MNEHHEPAATNHPERSTGPDGSEDRPLQPQRKQLYRSTDQRMIYGVCGGIGEYFDIDPNLVRVIFALLLFFGGSGILLYVVLAIILPDESKLDMHPRQAVRATVDEAVTGTKDAVGQAGNWVREQTGRFRS